MARNIPKPTAADIFNNLGTAKPVTVEQEHTPTPTPVEVKKPKELRNKRLQLTQFPSVVEALALYAEDKETSVNRVVEELVVDLLKKEGYLK